MESDVIPEDDTYTPEMREHGKTKRRSDARISWPKFHTLGRKSHFTRSHSSSEADEQRKLELSPPTSDTESPIKSQDAVKGKKRNKMKLSFLKKRGRVGSSEDLETDTVTTGQISGKMVSPECPESSSGETPEVYVTASEDLQNEQQLTHKMELITIDSTLKTEDLTVALADQESPSGAKSPEGKKKKKERSELKMKILGKDKSHKKEAKAKASPKRLKTLGASIEIADQPENEKSNVIPGLETHKELKGDEQGPGAISAKPLTTQTDTSLPKVELEISDVALVKKSPKKGEAKTKKDKDNKQKQETKTFKLPKIGFGDIDIQKTNVNVEDCTTKIEPPTSDGTEVKEDPYERLSKSSLSKTQLPKREDIEIPGMEDLSRKTAARGIKEPKVVYTGHYDEITSETMPMSIDVDSVKEAVSKLPGFKLPKVDTSGVPIPEEITVIDANAQRISVKTPTKVVDNKSKHETHFTRFDTSASTSISKTTVKLPKVAPDGLASEVLLIEAKVEKKDKPQKLSGKEIKTEVYKREDIIIPGKESADEEAVALGSDDKRSKKKTTGIAMPDIKIPHIGFDFGKQNLNQEKDDNIKGGRTIVIPEVQTSKTETKKAMGHIGGAISDVKVPEIDGIEYIDSVSGSQFEKNGGIGLTGFGVNLDASKPNADISFPEIKREAYVYAKEHTSMDKNIDAGINTIEQEGQGSKFKIPNLGLSMPKVKGLPMNTGLSEKGVDVTLTGAKAEAEHQEVPRVEVTLGGIDVSIQEEKLDVEKSELAIKTQQTDLKLHGQGRKITMPELGIKMPKLKGPQFDLSLSKKGADVKLPEANAEVKLIDAPEIDVTLGNVEISIPEPDLEIKPLQTEGELDRHGGKIKMPKIGITMPELEGPDIDLRFSEKDVDVILPKAKAKVETPEGPKVSVDIQHPKSEAEIGVQGSKVKKLGITMPKVNFPEIDFSSSKKDVDVKLPEAKADVRLPDAELKSPSAKVDIKVSKSKSVEKNMEGSTSKFKMPSLKLPKFGGATQNAGVEISKKNKGIPIPETQLKPLEEGAVDITAPSVDIEGPSLDVKKTQAELDGKGHKFKIPKFGASVPKLKGPEIDLSFSQRKVGVPEAKAEVKLPQVECTDPDIKVEIKAPEIEVQQQDFEGSPSRFKMPTFKLPKFGFDMTHVSVEERDMDKDMKIEGPDLNIQAKGLAVNIAAPKIDTEGPSIDMQSTGTKLDGKGTKFKMPHLGISMPKAKGPKLDFNLSRKDTDVSLPVAEVDVKLPEVDFEAADVPFPERMEIPDAKVEVKLPETTQINVDMKPPEFETDGSSLEFKIPTFGINLPKVKGPEVDLSLSKKDVDMALPQTKLEVKLPDVPKFDVSLGKAEVTMPEAMVKVKQPEVELKPLETDIELERKGGKFKMPKFGITMPKVKGPEIDLNFSKKDLTLSEANAEVKLPDVDLKKSSAEVEIEAQYRTTRDIAAQNIDIVVPSLDVKITETEGVGKEGKFKVPKFGISLPKVQGTKIDVSSPKKGVDVKLPDAKAQFPEAPEIDVKLGKVDLSIPEAKIEVKKPQLESETLQFEGELAGQESKFKTPKFGISMPKVKGPEFDFSLSKKDEDTTQPKAKAEVILPDVKLQEHSAKVEIKAPGIEAQSSNLKASPSKFKMPTFKFPKFGVTTPNVSAEVPDMDKNIKIEGADLKISVPSTDIDVPKVEAEVKLPEVEVKDSSEWAVKDDQPGVEFDIKLKKPKFSLPSFSFSKQSVKAPEVDVSLQSVNVAIPEGKVEVKGGEVDLQLPEGEAKVDGERSKFTMPKFGFTMPEVTGPEIDFSLSKKDGNVTLPEAKAEVQILDLEVKKPSAELEIKAPEIKVAKKDTEGSPSKYKLPTFKLPKFGVGMPSAVAEVPEANKDLKIDGADIKIPEEVLTVDIGSPSIDMKMTGIEHEGKAGKFKMPKFGITMPKVTGPEIDINLSKKDIDVTLPEAKAEVKRPEVELQKPSAEVEFKAPEIKIQTKDKDGSPSKFKMPTFKLPKFGVSIPSATVELPETNKDLKIDGADIKLSGDIPQVDIAAPRIDIEGPSIEMQTSGTEHVGKGSKFKMPTLGLNVPQVKQPDIDLSLSKKDVNVTLPEVKAEVKLPDVKMNEPSAELDIKDPEIKVAMKNTVGSPTKFKMPTFKLPKFGVSMPSATVEVPDTNKDVKIDGGAVRFPEEVLTVAAPNIDIEGPAIDVKSIGTEQEVKGSKFKMPKFGITMPNVTGPEIDLSLSTKNVDLTLPEAKAEVKLPDVELQKPSSEVEFKSPEIKVQTKDKEGSPSKFKMPTFKLPKFGMGSPSAHVELPETDKELKIDGADMKIPEEVLQVVIATPSIDIEGPSIEIKSTGTEHVGKGSKFKMPSLGFNVPQVKRPDIDLSLSKKDVNVTLPEVKAEVKLPDVEMKEPSAEFDIKDPEIKVALKNKEGSPSKYKMPTFKLPKFGVSTPSATVEVPETNKNLKIDGADMSITEDLNINIAAPSIDIEGPSIEMKTSVTEHPEKGSKFKMPKIGVSKPKVKGPDIDINLSKKDVDVTLPEAKAEVKLPEVELQKPSAEVEFKSPEKKLQTKDKEGSPSKFKMPTFKLPKFGVSVPSVTVDMPETNKDLKIDGADMNIPEDLKINIAAPSIDIEGPSIEMKTTGTEHPEKGSKFKMPKLGVSMPKVKGPDININLSKKDVDVTLPEAKAEVKLPDVELQKPSAEVEFKSPEIKLQTKDKEGSPSKFKMPTFKLPKFGVSMPSATVEVPETNKDLKIDGADMNIPDEDLKINIAAPSIDIEGPSIEMKTTGTEHPEKGSKFKMLKLGVSMPKVKGPDIDINLSKKDVDVTLPEAKAEVKLPDVEVKKPSAELEIKAPEIKVVKKDTEVSPSKYKLPTFKLPKFGVGMPSAVAEVPETNKDLKIDGPDITIPEEVLTVDIEGSSIDMKMTGIEHEGKAGKFKMPKFGITMPKVTGPEIDINLSKKDIDVTLPEAKAEVKLPEVVLQKPSAEVEFKAPEIKVQTKDKEGSPSKFKMPTFKLPKFGIGIPSASVELPETKKDLKIDGADIKISGDVPQVDISAPHIDIEGPSKDIKIKGIEHEGKGSKFKMPSLGFSGSHVQHPDIDLSLSKKDVDVTLPEAKAKVQLSGVELKESSAKVEVITPQVDVQTSYTEGSPTKFKMPTFKLPKFGASAAQVSVEVPNIDKNIKIDKEKLEISKEGVTVDVTRPSSDIEGISVDLKGKGSEIEGSGSKFKLPNFGISMPKVKGPEIDLSLSNINANVTLPEAKAEVKLPEVEFKEHKDATAVPDAPTVEVEAKSRQPSWTFPKFSFSRTGTKAPDGDIDFETAEVDVSLEVAKEDPCPPDVEVQVPSGAITMEELPAVETESNLKKSRFSLPRLSFSKSSIKEPEVSAELPQVDVSLSAGEVIITQPQLESITELETKYDGQGSKIKLPTFGISMPKVKGPEIDLSLSNIDANVTLPEAKAEVKLPEVEFKEHKDATAVPDAPTVEVEAKSRQPSWTFPKFSFSRTGAKAPDGDIDFETAEVDVSLKVAKEDPCPPDVEVQVPSGAITTEELSAVETDVNLKKSRFSLPRLSFSKSSIKEPEVSAEIPHVDVSLSEGEVIVTQPQLENITEHETEYDGQGSKFKLPKFGIALPKAKGPQEELNAPQNDVEIKLPEVKVQVKLPKIEVKSASSVDMKASETEAKAKDIGGSPLTLKGPSVEFKTDVETPTTETESQGSPSKFKLPSFKMPRLSFSKPKPEDQSSPVEAECLEEQLEIKIEPKEENKSPKMTLTSIGEMFQNFDVEFQVPKTDTMEGNLENAKEVHKADGLSGKLEEKEKETHIKQDATRSPERTGWFKFPRFGLSSPSEPAKSPEKDKKEKSPEGETVDDTISPTCSVQSSDAFADISSAMTSEHVGLSLSSPTKVTVKYSDPNTATGLGEVHRNIITSTTRTELFSVEPNLPEKITILSSGVSSSSEDTLRLESGKIHVITSNIEATPEAQHAKLLTTVQVQSVGGLPLRSEGKEAASWTVEDSQGGKKTVFERHLVTETSSERSESKETIVITKQITRMLDSAEHISGETASSIQRLRETVHSEKMRFFDEAEK
ncbi:neuroblast differentiation-associated protein AHNAK [Labrus bergylta]|uniref:neuroblast differentiation-associated protein AHNAK n=1 Tax=Labrus bergylta TaxID=56723 RepID=UPI0033143769